MSITRTKTTDEVGRLVAPKRRMTSKHVTASLFAYFRFRRRYLCADEVSTACGRCDVLVDTGKSTIEVEVKMTRHDLYSGEEKKEKHTVDVSKFPNFFYVCVPQELRASAVAWTENVNPKYGVMIFMGWKFLSMSPELAVTISKPAAALHEKYHNYREKIAMRLCSAAATRKIKETRK